MSYLEQYQQSIKHPEKFWADKANDIAWFKRPQTTLSYDEHHIPRWFVDGELNSSYLALDYHVDNGRADQVALIYDSPVAGVRGTYTYRELRDQVALFAGAMQRIGIVRGDRVLIYMPMVPQAAIAMLACARIGAIHSVVFGGFASKEVASRIDDACPKLIVTASCGMEAERVIEYLPIIDAALSVSAHMVDKCVVLQRKQCEALLSPVRDISWAQFTEGATPSNCVALKSTDPLYILYTSGTTGQPKGVVRDNGGHAVALKYSMKAIYDIDPGEVFWAASDVGWVVGHSYIVYAPLFAGCTSVLFEGKPVGTPDAGAFWRVIEQYHVKAVFAAPTAFRAIKKVDPEGELLGQYHLESLKTVFLAGERTDPPTYHWLVSLLDKPVIDHWWQTETGWSMVANMMGLEALPVKPGSATVPVVGFDVQVLGDDGFTKAVGDPGQIVVKQPLPPGCFPAIWNDLARYQESYMSTFPGYYLTGDGGYIDEDGYIFIMGRTDDVINVAGHRFSTGEMEELIAGHKSVAECAVIGIHNEIKGQVPLALMVLKDGVANKGLIEEEIVAMARRDIGAVACLRQVLIVQRLPKTRSGKILRKILRQMADKEEYVVPSTIEDPSVLDEVRRVYNRQLSV